MTKPKGKGVNEPEDVVLVADEVEEIPEAAPAAAPVPGRKALGVKEPIIFKWKIVGHSRGVAVTLFKSVEREDADVQLERLIKDGYYAHLEIMDANAKVIQPEASKEPKRPAKPRETPGKPPGRSVESKKSAKVGDAKRTSSPRRSTSAKAADKSRAKSARTQSSKATPRKLAKKK
ncbi:MAG: hypothetical protein Q7R41_00410 [Phycisphaerales bacterium]|nr:hypothetical protein [Phycisphaerales bacterium]